MDIRAYSPFNSTFLGSKPVPHDTGALDAEEVEGFAIFLLSDVIGEVHTGILDNALTTGPYQELGDVYLRRLKTPNLSVL